MKKRPNGCEKTERICVRLTVKEKKKLMEKAEKAQISVGEFLRRCIDQDVMDYVASMRVSDLIYEVKRIGNNVNQIAHNANCGYYSKADSDRMLANMEEVKAVVGRVAEKVEAAVEQEKR